MLARQAASLAVLSGGRFVLGLGLGDDWVGEFSAFGDEADPKVRGRMLDEGLEVLTGLLAGETVDHEGEHHAARDVRFLPAPRVPIWLAGRYGNRAPLRRAARYDGFFVIGLDGPADLDTVTADLAAHEPGPGFDVVVDLQPDQDPAVGRPRGLVGAHPDRTVRPRPRRGPSDRPGGTAAGLTAGRVRSPTGTTTACALDPVRSVRR